MKWTPICGWKFGYQKPVIWSHCQACSRRTFCRSWKETDAFIGMPTFSDFIGIGVFSHVFNYVLISLDQNHNKVGSNMKHPATRMFWTKRAFFFETHTSYHITIIVCTDKNRKNVRTGRRGLWTQKKHVCTIKLQWSCGFYWCNSTCTNGHAAQWSAQQPPRQTCISYEAKASIPYYINLSIFNCTQIF